MSEFPTASITRMIHAAPLTYISLVRSEASQVHIQGLTTHRLHDDAVEFNWVFARNNWQQAIEVKTSPEVQIDIEK